MLQIALLEMVRRATGVLLTECNHSHSIRSLGGLFDFELLHLILGLKSIGVQSGTTCTGGLTKLVKIRAVVDTPMST